MYYCMPGKWGLQCKPPRQTHRQHNWETGMQRYYSYNIIENGWHLEAHIIAGYYSVSILTFLVCGAADILTLGTPDIQQLSTKYSYPLLLYLCQSAGDPGSSKGFCLSYHSNKCRSSDGRQCSETLAREFNNWKQYNVHLYPVGRQYFGMTTTTDNTLQGS